MIKEAILNNKWITAVILVSTILLSNIVVWNHFEKQELKKELLKQSDEEVLITNIKTSKQTILDLENLLKTTEQNKNQEVKRNSCLKQQLDRLVEWLVYNLDYCNSQENIEKFELGE